MEYKNLTKIDLFPLKFSATVEAEMDNENALAKIFITPSKLLGKYLRELASLAGKYYLFKSSNKTDF